MRLGFLGFSVVVVTLALVACDSSDNPMAPSDSNNNGAPSGPTSSEVEIVANDGDQSFSPNPAQVGGQMVAWRNTHGQTHRIRANDGSFDTGNIAPGATSTMVALPAAGLNYHCSIHPSMVGAIGGSNGEPPPPCTGQC